MTPKEKAEELVDKFYQLETKHNYKLMLIPQAKQCALIAVDEVIEYIKTVHFKPEEFTDNNLRYFQKVKNEIEKI